MVVPARRRRFIAAPPRHLAPASTCAPARASLSPSPVMVLTPLWGEAATTSWPPWRRMATVFEPISPVPPMTTIFMVYPPLSDWRPRIKFECASDVAEDANHPVDGLIYSRPRKGCRRFSRGDAPLH